MSDEIDTLVKCAGRRVRAARLERGLSSQRLAEATGLARATITGLERGVGNPTLETLYALANHLELPITDLIAPAPPPVQPTVVRRGQGLALRGAHLDAVLLSHVATRELTADVYAVSIPARRTHESDAHAAGTIEHIHVHRGRLRLTCPDSTIELAAGDFASFDASRPHAYRAGRAEVTMTMVVTVERRSPAMP